MIAAPPTTDGRVRVADLTEAQGQAAAAALGRMLGVLSPAERIRRDRWLASHWYLIRNVAGEYGERLKCIGTVLNGRVVHAGCGGVHDFITHRCLPRPYQGKEPVLLYLAANTRDGRASRLMKSLPLLMRDHPRTARELAQRDDAETLLAWVVGRVEPIDAAKGRRMEWDIQCKDPTFTALKL
jgi:hypothetical protein